MPTIWTLSDLHLSISTPSKHMRIFGQEWEAYEEKIAENWKQRIHADDLVLLPGDICWAKTLEEALIDFQFLDNLPGIKVLVKGNHDYFFSSLTKLQKLLPPSLHYLHNTAWNFSWHGKSLAIGGTRLWDTPEYDFASYILFKENPKSSTAPPPTKEQDSTIFAKELIRLETSLQLLDPHADLKIALTHYPPIGADLQPSQASAILEKYHIDICVFGHLHSVHKNALPFGTARGVRYVFASADYVDFTPIPLYHS